MSLAPEGALLPLLGLVLLVNLALALFLQQQARAERRRLAALSAAERRVEAQALAFTAHLARLTARLEALEGDGAFPAVRDHAGPPRGAAPPPGRER